ncbi:MAG: TrmB family transcriptional regulator [Candidatus Woesearchaeota archaeon]
MDKLASTLVEYGLSEKEAKVYISTLMLGKSKVNEISKKSALLRETTYAVLKQLMEKGLVNYTIQSGVKSYSAAPASKLIEMLEEKKRKIHGILKELNSLQSFNMQKPVVEFYEGEEGLMTATNDIVRRENVVVEAYVNTKILQSVRFYHPGFRLRRRENNIFMNVIAEKSKETEELKKTDKKEYRKTSSNNNIMKDLPVGFYVYEDKILFIKANEHEHFGIIIQDKELAELQRRCYAHIWKNNH